MNRTIFLKLKGHRYHAELDGPSTNISQGTKFSDPMVQQYYEYLRAGGGDQFFQYEEIREFIAKAAESSENMQKAELAVLAAQLCHQDEQSFQLAMKLLGDLVDGGCANSINNQILESFYGCIQALCRWRYQKADQVLHLAYKVYRALYMWIDAIYTAAFCQQAKFIDVMGLFNHYIMEYQRKNIALEPQEQLVQLIFKLLQTNYNKYECGGLIECLSVLLQDLKTLEYVCGPGAGGVYIQTLSEMQQANLCDKKLIQLVVQIFQTASGDPRGLRSVQGLFDCGIMARYFSIIGEREVYRQITGLFVHVSVYSRVFFNDGDKILPIIQLLQSTSSTVVNNCLCIIDTLYHEQGNENILSFVPLLAKNLLRILTSKRLDEQLLQNVLCIIVNMQEELDNELVENGFLDILYKIQNDCTDREMDIIRLFLNDYQ